MDRNLLEVDPAEMVLPRTSLAVAVEVLVHGPQSRARLAERMNLSPASLTRLVKPLLAAGVLVEADPVRASALGRSSLLLDVVDDYRFVGIKLTSDTAYGVLTDHRARVLDTASAELPTSEAHDVVDAIRGLMGTLTPTDGLPLDGLGVSVGGKVENGRVVDSRYLGWTDLPLQELLATELGLPAYVGNDVVGLTNAEHWFGWGRGYPDFALLTVGAGIGYGLVLGDRLVPTETGPVGHLPIHPGGPVCSAGHRGCLASYATIASITTSASLGHRSQLDFAQVVELARSGDAIATRVLGDAAWALGRAASTISDVTSVRRVILSGEAVVIAEVAAESFDAGLREYHPEGSAPVEVVVQPADFFEWARGAAVVAIQREFPRGRRDR